MVMESVEIRLNKFIEENKNRIEAIGDAKKKGEEAYKSRVLQFSLTYTF